MPQQPTYILAPNFRFKPETGPIRLGSIISNPLQPHRAITTIDETKLDLYPQVEKFTEYDRAISRAKGRDISMSVWTQFVEIMQAKVTGGRGRDIKSAYNMESLETRYFVTDPSLEEIKSRLMEPRVQAVTKANRTPGFRSPVYMVTGVMIAKGLSIEQESARREYGEVELYGEAPTPGGQVGAGISIGKSRSTEASDKWRVEDDVVFAYQLLKIEAKGWKGTKIVYDELRSKDGLLAESDEEESDEEESDEEESDEEESDEESDLGEVSTNQVRADELLLEVGTETAITGQFSNEGISFTWVSAC